MEFQFIGAIGTVTGSKYLVRHQDSRVLVGNQVFHRACGEYMRAPD